MRKRARLKAPVLQDPKRVPKRVPFQMHLFYTTKLLVPVDDVARMSTKQLLLVLVEHTAIVHHMYMKKEQRVPQVLKRVPKRVPNPVKTGATLKSPVSLDEMVYMNYDIIEPHKLLSGKSITSADRM